jgi:2-haloacid dehalogenase
VSRSAPTKETIVSSRISYNERRYFLLQAGAVSVSPTALAAAPRLARAAPGPALKALAIDGLAVFDPRPVAALVERLFPQRSAAPLPLWRTRQFEYSWLRTLMGRYVDFWQVSEEALVFAAAQLELDLRAAQRDQVMQSFLSLEAWPDVRPAFLALREAGIRLALLSNFTERMLDAASRSAGIADLLEPPLSTDRVRAYKPHPRAYQMGVDAFGLQAGRMARASVRTFIDFAAQRLRAEPLLRPERR